MPDHFIPFDARGHYDGPEASASSSQEQVDILSVQEEIWIENEPALADHRVYETTAHQNGWAGRPEHVCGCQLRSRDRLTGDVRGQRSDLGLQHAGPRIGLVQQIEYGYREKRNIAGAISQLVLHQFEYVGTYDSVRIEGENGIARSQLDTSIHSPAETHVLWKLNDLLYDDSFISNSPQHEV
jgi:hypothetical protein